MSNNDPHNRYYDCAACVFKNDRNRACIPVTVTTIGNYFIADSAYVTIRYQGTQEQWDAITKTSMWNYGNRGVELVFAQA